MRGTATRMSAPAGWKFSTPRCLRKSSSSSISSPRSRDTTLPNSQCCRRAMPPISDLNVGSGRMEILDASVPSKIVIKLDFFTPFEGHNTAEFTMLPQGDATNLTWAMHGPAPFMSKVMQVFINMDNMIGKDFAIGLANLKRLTEK